MAIGTGNLPYPWKSYTPFDILTAEELNEDVANIESLATGTGIGDGAVTADKIDLATFNVLTGSIALNQTSGWTNTDTIDVSSFPDGSKLEVFVTAYIEATSTELRGIRIIGDVNPCLETVNIGEYRTLDTTRIITKSSPTIAIQTIGSWVASSSKAGGYIVKRVG